MLKIRKVLYSLICSFCMCLTLVTPAFAQEMEEQATDEIVEQEIVEQEVVEQEEVVEEELVETEDEVVQETTNETENYVIEYQDPYSVVLYSTTFSCDSDDLSTLYDFLDANIPEGYLKDWNSFRPNNKIIVHVRRAPVYTTCDITVFDWKTEAYIETIKGVNLGVFPDGGYDEMEVMDTLYGKYDGYTYYDNYDLVGDHYEITVYTYDYDDEKTLTFEYVGLDKQTIAKKEITTKMGDVWETAVDNLPEGYTTRFVRELSPSYVYVTCQKVTITDTTMTVNLYDFDKDTFIASHEIPVTVRTYEDGRVDSDYDLYEILCNYDYYSVDECRTTENDGKYSMDVYLHNVNDGESYSGLLIYNYYDKDELISSEIVEADPDEYFDVSSLCPDGYMIYDYYYVGNYTYKVELIVPGQGSPGAESPGAESPSNPGSLSPGHGSDSPGHGSLSPGHGSPEGPQDSDYRFVGAAQEDTIIQGIETVEQLELYDLTNYEVVEGLTYNWEIGKVVSKGEEIHESNVSLTVDPSDSSIVTFLVENEEVDYFTVNVSTTYQGKEYSMVLYRNVSSETYTFEMVGLEQYTEASAPIEIKAKPRVVHQYNKDGELVEEEVDLFWAKLECLGDSEIMFNKAGKPANKWQMSQASAGNEFTIKYDPADGIKRIQLTIYFDNALGVEESITLEYAFMPNEEPFNLEVNTTPFEMGELTTEAISYTVSDENAVLTWESSNTDVATVDNKGNVTAVAPGKTTISVSGPNGAYAEVQVTVADHAWLDWKEITAPTCTEKGVEQRTCPTCKKTETREGKAALGHIIKTDRKDPTCDQEGSEKTTCDRCKEVLSAYVLPALGHDYQESLEKSTAATCTEDGSRVYVCTRCHGERSETIKALGHKLSTVTVNPTCTEKGSNTTTCSRCDYKVVEDIDALGHVEQIVPGKYATCTEGGFTESVICARCEEILVDKEFSDPLGHDVQNYAYVAPTCTKTGLKDGKYCDRCKEELEPRITVPALGHDYKVEVVAPKVGEKGYTLHTCTRGDDTYKDNYTDALFKGWKKIGDYYYYGDANGKLLTGLQTIGSKTYFFNVDGRMLTNTLQDVDGKSYYFGNDGVAKTGWVKMDGKYYYFNPEMQFNVWMKGTSDGKWYYVKPDGTMAADEVCEDATTGKIYSFDAAGRMETGWKKIDGKYYYFANEMKFSEWFKGTSDGKWYYVKEDGTMAADEVCPDNTGKIYKFDYAGRMESGWKKLDDGKWYYFGNEMKFDVWMKGTSDGRWYYVKPDGTMAADEVCPDNTGKIYSFDKAGRMESGWKEINKQWYYFGNAMTYGWKKISNKWYYFKENGVMASSETLTIDGVKYVFASNGSYTKA